ncbi:MAG: cell division protein ZapA [Bacillota bacterium]
MDKKQSSNKNKKNRIVKAKVDILGEQYMMKSDKSEAYINNIASFVDYHLTEIKDNSSAMPRNRLFLLGLMNLADDLYTIQNDHQQLEEEFADVNKEKEDLKRKNDKLAEKYEELKEKHKELQEEYNQFLDLVDEKGGLND